MPLLPPRPCRPAPRAWLLALLAALALPVLAGMAAPARADMAARDGFAVTRSTLGYAELLARTKQAALDHGLGLVTEAGPTEVAASRGILIPGNRVIGVFNNDLAVRVLQVSTAAMIEAPLRLYVTENADGSATLSYKRPSAVFAPYLDEGGAALEAIALDLDATLAKIAWQATTRRP